MNKRLLETLSMLFSIDFRALAAVRIGMGLIVVFDVLWRLPLVPVLYTGDGAYPVEIVREDFPCFLSIHTLGSSLMFQMVLFWLTIAVGLMIVLGYRTAVAVPVCWYLLTSMHVRCILATNIGDILLSLLLLWSVFLPLGARYSIDARRKGESGKGLVFTPASAGLMLQVAFVFFFSAFEKISASDSWHQGTALQFVLDDGAWSLPLGAFLLQYPMLSRGLTYYALVVELVAPLLLFIPWGFRYLRPFATVLLFTLPIGFGSCIFLGIIPFVVALSVLVFVPERFWDRFDRAVGRAGVKGEGGAGVDKSTPVGPLRGWQPVSRTLLIVIPSIMLIYITLANAERAIPGFKVVPDAVHQFAESINAKQWWPMFSKAEGSSGHERMLFRGELDDGSEIEFSAGSKRPGWRATEPWQTAEFFWENLPARQYLYGGVAYPTSTLEVEGFLDWLCRQWDLEHPDRPIRLLHMAYTRLEPVGPDSTAKKEAVNWACSYDFESVSARKENE